MTKKKLLNSLYRKFEDSITDKELLTGREYAEYCSKVADGITSNYGANTTVVITADDRKGARAAFTDGGKINVNAWNGLINKGADNVTKRHWGVLGMIVHECGHILWSNFKAMLKGQDMLRNSHSLYPAPDGDISEIKEFLDENPRATESVINLWHTMMNCIEDGFIEKLLLVKFPGYGQYLSLVRNIQEKDLPPYKKQKEEGLGLIPILTNLTLSQAKFGRVPEFDEDELKEDVVKTFFSIKPLIDEAVDERSSYFRQKKMNELFITIFHIFKEEVEKEQKNKQQQQQQQSEQGSKGQSGQQRQSQQGKNDQSEQQEQSNGNGNSGQGEENQNGQSENGGSADSSETGNDENTSGGEQGSSETGNDENTSGGEQGSSDPVKDAAQALSDALEQASSEASKNITENCEHNSNSSPVDDEQTSQSVSETSKGGESNGPANNGSQPDSDGTECSTSSALEKIKKDKIKHEVEQEVEEEIKKQAIKDSDEIAHDNSIHKGVISKIIRTDPKQGVPEYNLHHQYLDTLARRMMKNLEKELRDRKIGDALDGNYFGNRLDTNNLYRRDKKLYIKDILPENVPDMEVSIVVDCSGSMSGKKMEVAKKTAYTVWKFCSMLNIPVSVIGHDTRGGVRLFQVADRDSIDGNDGKRIFSLHAWGCNRDGFVLRYALKRLLKSQADDKLLFVISDGCPNDGTYGREQGRADIRDAVAKAKKEGVAVITAGLGESAEHIKDVWTNGVSPKRAASFLELSDMDKLPRTFVKIIKAQLAS